jgi:hypothetical protein
VGGTRDALRLARFLPEVNTARRSLAGQQAAGLVFLLGGHDQSVRGFFLIIVT